MNISKELKQYATFAPHSRLVRLLKKPRSLCPEPISAILPSFGMGADGLILASLFLITPNYMCEVRVSGRDEEFDFIDLKTVRNYRINLGKHVLKREGGKPIRLKTATITLLHFPGFVSELAYIGDNPEKYVKTVTQAIPITCASFQQA